VKTGPENRGGEVIMPKTIGLDTTQEKDLLKRLNLLDALLEEGEEETLFTEFIDETLNVEQITAELEAAKELATDLPENSDDVPPLVPLNDKHVENDPELEAQYRSASLVREIQEQYRKECFGQEQT
jgi:hypothetical protein